MSKSSIIKVESLSFGWTEPVLKSVSFELEAGQILAFLGPNGAGKSTLLRLLSGQLEPQGGSFRGALQLGGEDLFTMNPKRRALRVSYLGSEFNSEFPLTAEQAVSLASGYLMGNSQSLQNRIEEAFRLCGCEDLKSRELSTLSGGQRQRVGLVRILAQCPEVMVLDESLSKMDLDSQFRIGQILKEWVRKDRRAILWVAHDLYLVSRIAHSILWLNQGSVLAQGPTSAMLDQSILSRVYPQIAHLLPRNWGLEEDR